MISSALGLFGGIMNRQYQAQSRQESQRSGAALLNLRGLSGIQAAGNVGQPQQAAYSASRQQDQVMSHLANIIDQNIINSYRNRMGIAPSTAKIINWNLLSQEERAKWKKIDI